MLARMSLTKGLNETSKSEASQNDSFHNNSSMQRSRGENFETLAEISEKLHSTTPRRCKY
jgi:hypothetical protein